MSKLVYLIRKDLGMSKGKIAAQVGHATWAVAKSNINQSVLNTWQFSGAPKIAVSVSNEKELNERINFARNSSIFTHIVTDAGHTQVPSGTKTVGVIGPGSSEVIDRICRDLKLL